MGGGISRVFAITSDPKVASDVLFGKTIEWVGMDVRIQFGNSRSNHF